MLTDTAPKHPAVDIVIVGAGIAGLWLANILKRRGFAVPVVEKDSIGGGQTLASQGMIHGGQKYALSADAGAQAQLSAAMPARWQACFDGCGELDLTSVAALSEQQVMWPAGGILADAAVFAAAKVVNAATHKLKRDEFPEALTQDKKFKGPVYGLPEKVLDVRSLLTALARPLKGAILKAAVTEVMPDGQVAIEQAGRSQALQAQLVIFTAGAGNEDAFRFLRLDAGKFTQRRPLRQVMVKHLPFALYGHGVVSAPKPRLTVTAARVDDEGYVWYLGGDIAEKGAAMDDAQAIDFAAQELAAVFPAIDWSNRQWATWFGDRAEPANPDGHLPAGPHVHQRGRVLMAWPTKLTFAPALADRVLEYIKTHHIAPHHPLPDLDGWPQAGHGSYPWETATWTTR